MRNLDLFSLSLFVAICETRSISRAAERMNIVASAASRRVGLLEHEAGLPLLIRRPHGVEPTSAGLIVLRYARDVMHLGQKVEAELEDHRSGASGTIRVYASSSVLVECLAADLAAFAKEQPAIKIDLEERPSIDTLEALYRKQADVGVVVHNVATARAVHQAVRHGRPLTARVVTVSGGAVRQPKNIEVPIGTRVGELIDFCGGFVGTPLRLINGGPMMGQPLPGLDVPVVKGSSGVLALTAAEVNEQAENPCVRCGSCVSICPCGLVPVELASYIRHDKIEGAEKLGVGDCMSCGSCSWVCPSHIPLSQYFGYAKGVIAARQRESRKLEQTRVLAEARTQRLEKEAAERKAAAAARRAAMNKDKNNEVTA